jgi:hypothetical protein
MKSRSDNHCNDECPRLFELRTKLLYYHARVRSDGISRLSREHATKLLLLSDDEERNFVVVCQMLGNSVCTVKATRSGIQVTAGSGSDRARDVKAIFDHWRTKTEHPRAKLIPARRTKIEARLREGYSREELLEAIDGLTMSDWHMGRDPKTKGRRYDGIDNVFRNGEYLERFVAIARRAQGYNRERTKGVRFHHRDPRPESVVDEGEFEL